MKTKSTRRKTARKKAPARKAPAGSIAKFFSGKSAFWRQVRTKGLVSSIARSFW